MNQNYATTIIEDFKLSKVIELSLGITKKKFAVECDAEVTLSGSLHNVSKIYITPIKNGLEVQDEGRFLEDEDIFYSYIKEMVTDELEGCQIFDKAKKSAIQNCEE